MAVPIFDQVHASRPVIFILLIKSGSAAAISRFLGSPLFWLCNHRKGEALREGRKNGVEKRVDKIGGKQNSGLLG